MTDSAQGRPATSPRTGAAIGRPRDSAIDRAVLTAASELLEELGYDDLTVDAVAIRAATSKAAIYRRYPSKAALLFAAAIHGSDSSPPPDTGSLSADLMALARQIRAQLLAPLGRAVAANIIAEMHRSPAAAQSLREQSTSVERAMIAALLGRAVARGELAATPQVDTVHRLLGGGLIGTVLAFGEELDDAALADFVGIVVAGLVATSAGDGLEL